MPDSFYTPTRLPAAPQDHTPAYDEADLTTCDREPIHVPGAVQPHGLLIAVDTDLVVTTVSANCADLLGSAPEQLIGRPLVEVLGEQTTTLIELTPDEDVDQDLFTVRLPEDLPGLTGRFAGTHVDVRTHRSGSRLVIELEELVPTRTPGLSLRSARRAIGRLAAQSTVTDLADQLVEEIRALLGFDRVMVYRFDPDWNGEVIAESKHEDLNSFHGLHYPATDIPAQARRLYTVNWTRLIADIGYTPVPLVPVLEADTGQPLDLSLSSLRSVSPIHIEYLGNMGVTASMSISIVVEEKLWGLVACHHYSGPLRPTYDTRSAVELLGQVASQMFFDREQAELREAGLDLSEQLAALVRKVELDGRDPLDALIEDPGLLPLMGAHGVALLNGDERRTAGTVPPWPVLEAIADRLADPEHYATASDALVDVVPELGGDVAGALRIGSAPDRWMLWLRPEIVQTVDWGGDPTNKLLAAQEPSEVRLSPRKSFEKWQQVVQGRSQPWTPAQIETAAALGVRVQALVLGHAREQVAMAESLQRSVVLDQAPDVDGVEVAARYLPATTYQLAGDWWDAIRLDEHRTAFVVGDVAGHGVQAASVMLEVRTALRSYLLEGHGPLECLDRVDRYVDRLLTDQVVTAVVAVVDRRSRSVSLARAGHPPVVVARRDSTELLETASRPVLGIALAGRSTDPTVLALEPGTALLLYSDGLVERRGESLEASMGRLTSPGLHLGEDSLELWLDRLVDLVGSDEGDDTTLLAIRLTEG